jgi:hypothetical protein
MYENGRIRPAETIPGMGGKEKDGGGEFNYGYIVRTAVHVTMYPQYNNKKRKKKNFNHFIQQKFKKRAVPLYHLCSFVCSTVIYFYKLIQVVPS